MLVKDYVDVSVRRAILESFTPRDFALAIDGARVVLEYTPEHTTKNPADSIIRDNLHGGSCWTLHGSQGQFGIATLTPILPMNVTIDHAPREVVEDIHQAPRRVVVWGVVEGPSNQAKYAEFRSSLEYSLERRAPPRNSGQTFIALSAFEYDVNSPRYVQTFPVFDGVLESRMSFGVFVFEIESNWGAPTTCVYRARLHGRGTIRCVSLTLRRFSS
ncbi:hypothetical protein C8Q79DRAFT_916249 [Trametes meyenii]|nr:hypothetical protein C8Q79DRAFT_916249 [Trametes meyenii]